MADLKKASVRADQVNYKYLAFAPKLQAQDVPVQKSIYTYLPSVSSMPKALRDLQASNTTFNACIRIQSINSSPCTSST